MKASDLTKLADPFPSEDIEWRVSRSGIGRNGVFCCVLAYITARAIQKRLDDVCRVEGWQLQTPLSLDCNGKSAFACGISINIDNEWITKWDVADPTNIEAAKGGFSGAMKRAGAQWGIGRYLYRLDETFADTVDKSDLTDEQKRSGEWNYATVKVDQDKRVFYWKTPGLPWWALPKEPEHEVSAKELKELKQLWRKMLASDCKNPGDLASGFQRFVVATVGRLSTDDHKCWTQDALAKCRVKAESATDGVGPDSDVPFD